MNKNKIRIDFSNGEAAQHVTGSCIYLPDLETILECGLSQSNSLERDYRENNEKFNFACKKIKYIIIGHCHLDHIGRIPLLYKRGCEADIIAPTGSSGIMRNMLEDSVKILERDALLLTKQKKHEYSPIYSQEDVDNALSHIKEYDFHELTQINEELAIKFIPSGHIRYSAQIELFINRNNVKKKLVYTSDLGNSLLPKYFSDKFEPIDKCDVLIGECTYADKNRQAATQKLRKLDIEKIESIIETYCIDNHSKILIPCFALDRTPEMFMIIKDILQKHG